ncbi:hypothetical protein S40285_06354 [Stachybotrys chlorohalonatus IBT 40285]|uniref:Cross-pathway control protein 1 n=1 Tax=Stachybotrys chlorohalonatus (strain IBT 40285) TaxID=1283841 RepID=A0A084QAU1_STAC4|nr:hypothetical protein S40285_06354 [Stachybotrys chlorohalonata IBT 40285]
MPQDPNLYGQRPSKKARRDAALPSSLDFTAQLTSLMSNSSRSGPAVGKTRAPKQSKEDIFNNKPSKRERKEDDKKLSLKEVHGTEEETHQLERSRRRMEDKARRYAAMKRGDYVPQENEAAPLVDFDRKWAESAEKEDYSDNTSDDEDEDDGEMVEYEDEFGRLRRGTKADMERMQRQARRGLLGAEELERMSARPAAPTKLIYGDTVQSMAFNPEDADKMEELARKRDRSATPPEQRHYDADWEIRTKGTGFYKFSKDEGTRSQEMEALEEERRKTEQQRQAREAQKEARRKEIEQLFTTDPQSSWLPNSAQNLPAPSAHQNTPENTQQDFVLFDSPQPRPHPNPSALLSTSQRRHSSHHNHRQQYPASSNTVHNHRVAQLLKAIGHPALSTVNANRVANHNHLYSPSSAPLSAAALNQHSRPSRPPVPLFSQSTGNVPQTAKMMNAADVDLDDFTYEGGASTAFSSPAIPTVFDFGSAPSSNMGTVSPQDLLLQEPFMSAPNSSALTALTSPSIYNESPEFDGFNVSPNFGSADFDGSADAWYPLFPQSEESKPVEPRMEDSPALTSDEIDSADRSPVEGDRRKSGTSPSGGVRHSSVAGVNARKRDKPLPPIIVEDPGDVVAMKRARNTLAARKSRERKAQRFEELEERIAKLEEERDHWKKIALAQSGAQ